MQFRIATLFWATLVVATSLALAGLWGLLTAAYWIVGLWWAAGPETKDRPRSVSNDVGNLLWLVAGFIAPLLCCGLLQSPFHSRVREAARRSVCASNLKTIALGLLEYRIACKAFPPAITRDAAGEPAHSWRVLLMPYIEQSPLFQRYDLKQPWNAPGNAGIAAVPPSMSCPSDPQIKSARTRTANYLAVVGPGTVWDTPAKPGPADTRISVVDVAQSGILWGEPRDLAAQEFLTAFNPVEDDPPTVRSPHPGGFHVAFVGGRVEWIPFGTPRALAETLLYEGLTPQAEKELESLQERYRDRHQPDPWRHIVWRIAAWLASLVAFGGHAFGLRRGQAEWAETESVDHAPCE